MPRGDGLELKGVGAYVIVPPAPGRYWIRNPFEFEVAQCPEFLLPQKEELAATEGKPVNLVVDRSTGAVTIDLSNPLAELRAAKPGNRRRTLLRTAGRLKYRADRGQIKAEKAWSALAEAARSVGLKISTRCARLSKRTRKAAPSFLGG